MPQLFEKEKDVARMACNTPTCTYGCKLAAVGTLTRLHPGVLRAMRLPSRARISESRRQPG